MPLQGTTALVKLPQGRLRCAAPTLGCIPAPRWGALTSAVKSSYLLSFLESVPVVAARLKESAAQPRKFEDVVNAVEQVTVLVLVY